jgi:hypothetical protein
MGNGVAVALGAGDGEAVACAMSDGVSDVAAVAIPPPHSAKAAPMIRPRKRFFSIPAILQAKG